MAVVENRFVCDLSKPVQAQALKGNVFSLDNLGSRLSVLIYNNGQPATISGSVTANCILPDGSTVNINGSLTTENGGSKAYVDVPQSCLLIPGILKIAIKCTSSSVITTLAAIVANVYMTKTDNVITPSQQIIDDWNAEISAAIGTQDAKILAIETKIGDTTLPTTAQTITGAIEEHETDIQTEITNRTNDVDNLKSALSADMLVEKYGWHLVQRTPEWSQGGISSEDGNTTTNSKRIRSSNQKGTCDCIVISIPSTMHVSVFTYRNDRSTAQYQGMIASKISPDDNGFVIVPMTKGMTFVVVAGYIAETAILPAAGSDITIWNGFIPRQDDNLLSGYASNESVIHGRAYPWVLGSISSTYGSNVSYEYTIRTDGHIPVTPGRTIRLNTPTTSSSAAFVYLYDSSKNYMFRISLTDGDITIPQGASFMRITYGNTSASETKVSNGMDYVDAFSITVINDTFKEYLNRLGFIDFKVTKGLWKNSGGIDTTSTAICTSTLLQIPIGKTVRVVISDPNWVYSVKQGDDTTHLDFTERLANYSEFEITKEYTGVMFYKKDANGDIVNANPEDFNFTIMLFVSDYSVGKESFIHAVPENIGVLNVVNRAYQMAKLTYAPIANLPTQVNTTAFPNYIPEGTKISGVMYSSVRDEGLYVPQCVSIQSYMTALLNENSYIYTKTEPSPHYNGLTYYGAVCSSMVGWCYGIDDVIATTISFGTYPGMEVIEDQSPYGLKLGDMLNHPGNHIEIVTDIVKNDRGIIQYVELTDQVNLSSHPWTRKRKVIPSYVQDMIDNQGYIAMHYHYIYKVPYTPSPWVNLDDETAEPIYNLNLSPRRGENANWRIGETIQIDVTDATGYTNAKLYKGETLISTTSIPAGNLIEYVGLEYGSYKVCLTNGTSDSEFVYFDIIDSNETFTPIGNKNVTVAYSSANGTPASISFCGADINDTNYKGVGSFHILTEAEVTAGQATVEAPATGTYLMKVMYKTAFGLYSGDLTSVTVS